jgi:hypothetical protein
MEDLKKYHTPYTIDLDSMTDPVLIERYMTKVKATPPPIISILTDDQTANYFEDNLGPSLNLNEPETENLIRITRDVLLGDLFIGDMAPTISEKLEIDLSPAKEVASKIFRELFTPAIEDVKKIQREKFPGRVGQGISGDTSQRSAPPQVKPAMAVNRENIIDLRNS